MVPLLSPIIERLQTGVRLCSFRVICYPCPVYRKQISHDILIFMFTDFARVS